MVKTVTARFASLDKAPLSGQIAMTPAALLPGDTRFAFIQSGWHGNIVNNGRDAFMAEMQRLGVSGQAIDRLEVPGAFELPLLAKKLAQSGQYAAVVACGFVVNGGIYRHEFVAEAVVRGLMKVQLATDVPVLSVVLTPLNFHDNEEHQKFFEAHMVVKGAEAARACLETVGTLRKAHALLEKNAAGNVVKTSTKLASPNLAVQGRETRSNSPA